MASWIRMGLVVGAMVLAGCAQAFDATRLGVPATMAGPAGEAVAGQSFKVTTHTVHALWGLVTLKRPGLEKALAGQLVGAKAIAQLRIKTKSRWSDLLITGLTLGIFAPKTVTYEGVVVGR
jgi:hypothetical protein